MIKYTIYFFISIIGTVALYSCNEVKKKPNDTYMPDMAYTTALKTYSDHSFLEKQGIHYNNRPVSGTIARGVDMPFPIPMDKAGDTINYFASRAIQNPYDSLTPKDLKETERLYLIYCGICHGVNMDGNGPLYKGGDGPFPAKPASLIGDVKYEAMPAGQMFYSVAYGKNTMGSYAAQLNTKQRWQVIAYIKQKQKAAKAAATPTETPKK